MPRPHTRSTARTSDDDERRLVARLRRRDEEAFVQLVSLNRDRLRAVAMRILRNEDDANDAVQTAFAAAFTAIDSFDAKSQVGTWLYRIAANAALMILRGRRRRPEESLSMALVKLGRAPSPVEACRIGPSESPEAIAIRNEETALLRVALEGLKPEQRQVIDLRHIQQLSTREAARYLSLTPNATKVRLHRARHALRRCYDDLSVPSTASGARCAAARRKTSSLHRRCS